MASTRNVSFFRRFLNPLRKACTIQIFNCFKKRNRNRKVTSKDEVEVIVQTCTKEEEIINNISTTCIKEEERHESPVNCNKPEQEISKDSDTYRKEESEHDITYAKDDQETKSCANTLTNVEQESEPLVEAEIKTQTCSDEDKRNNTLTNVIEEEKKNEVSPITICKPEQEISKDSDTYIKEESEHDITYAKDDQETKSCANTLTNVEQESELLVEAEIKTQTCSDEDKRNNTLTNVIEEEKKNEVSPITICKPEQEISKDSDTYIKEESEHDITYAKDDQETKSCANTLTNVEQESELLVEAEIKTQTCSDEDKRNNTLTNVIEEEKKNEVSPITICKPEQEISKDSDTYIKEESEHDITYAKDEQETNSCANTFANVEQESEPLVEAEIKTQTCSDEDKRNNTLTNTIEEEKKNEVSPITICKPEEERNNDSTNCAKKEHENTSPASCLKEGNTKKAARKQRKRRKQTTKVEPEQKTELCTNKPEENKLSNNGIIEKEKNGASGSCKAETEKNNDSTTCPKEEQKNNSETTSCVKEEQENESSTISLKEETTKNVYDVEQNTQEKQEEIPKPEETDKVTNTDLKAEDRKKPFTVCKKAKEPRDDVWIPELKLTQQHKKDLNSNVWLNEIIINAAQHLLKDQFRCEGLQSCTLSKAEFNFVQGASVQIHYDSKRNHWLTSCFKANHVEIADSLQSQQIPNLIKKQIWHCYRKIVKDPIRSMKILNVDRQLHGYDCGVYAIANAFEFLSSGNPMCSYDQRKIRRHLIRCFEKRAITAFPKVHHEPAPEIAIPGSMKQKPGKKGKIGTGQSFPKYKDDWLPELKLMQKHKNILHSNEWLDDTIIDAAQQLLKEQFGCEGLQSCILCELEFDPVNGPAVQIHCDVKRKHWLTSCFKEKHIEIADSLQQQQLSKTVKKQICQCYREVMCNPTSTMKILNVNQQNNSNDCGLYAIANAFEFLSNGNPTHNYDNEKMREHLIRCFEKGEMTAFPKKHYEHKLKIATLEHLEKAKILLQETVKKNEENWNGNDDWIPELNLKQRNKKDLQGTEYLDDTIIDAAQNLLKKQFKCEGLQSSLLSQCEYMAVNGPSVQIHHDRNHWVTSYFKSHHVEIADSLRKSYLTDTLKKQIRECYQALVNDPVETIKILDVDQQPNSYDCGVYAIANAYEFLATGNPTCNYNNREMREHLIHCLERREITAFPKMPATELYVIYNKRQRV